MTALWSIILVIQLVCLSISSRFLIQHRALIKTNVGKLHLLVIATALDFFILAALRLSSPATTQCGVSPAATYLGAMGMVVLVWLSTGVIYVLFNITSARVGFSPQNGRTHKRLNLFLLGFLVLTSIQHLVLIVGLYYPQFQDPILRFWFYASGVLGAAYSLLVPLGINPLLRHVDISFKFGQAHGFDNERIAAIKLLRSRIMWIRNQLLQAGVLAIVPHFIFASIPLLTRQIIWIWPSLVIIYTFFMIIISHALAFAAKESHRTSPPSAQLKLHM